MFQLTFLTKKCRAKASEVKEFFNCVLQGYVWNLHIFVKNLQNKSSYLNVFLE